MNRLVKALILGALAATSGVLLTLFPFTFDLEESWGLDLLFQLRGTRQPPPDIVVVSIDKESADHLGLPTDPARWPRSLHARLIASLERQGAAVIVFDLLFDQPRSAEDDQAFADAIRQTRNVILAAHLTRETVPLAGGGGASAGHLTIERLVPPLPDLAEAALALAPFPLPKVPVRVSQYWAFKAGAGDIPTLPVVAFQVFALDAYDRFIRLLEQASPGLAGSLPSTRGDVTSSGRVEEIIHRVRELFQRDPEVGERMREQLRLLPPGSADAAQGEMLAALLDLYAGPASRHLNFYGPPRTIATIPYFRALSPESATHPGSTGLDLRGKAVMVGLSEQDQSRQRDGFYTVFSQPSGSDLSGVEIAATALANLRERMPVRPLPVYAHLAIVLIWGVSIGVLARLLPTLASAPGVIAGSLLYGLLASHVFTSGALWLPLVIPLLFQVPLAFLGAVLWRYFDTYQERQVVRKALRHYLPSQVADQLVRDFGDVMSSNQLVHGTCLSTDAQRYTALAELLGPKDLAALLNKYYAALFDPVKQYGGMVQDVVGDSMLAIWATPHPDAGQRQQACLAALAIASTVDRFNAQAGTQRLPTRIGLHAGEMLLGNVGAIDHFEYRAVGDIVTTATRLEGLNKHLGTRILLTEDVLNQVNGFLTRELGTFLLAGKSRPLVVHELVGRNTEAIATQPGLYAVFAEALAAYRGQSWKEAMDLFHECLVLAGEDGPSRFYARLCAQYLEQPPGGTWDGVVRFDQK